MPYLTIAKPAFGTLEGFQKIMSAQAIGQGEPEGLQARYVADVGDGIRVVAVWESSSTPTGSSRSGSHPRLRPRSTNRKAALRCCRAKS
jgi:hypothetical protein